MLVCQVRSESQELNKIIRILKKIGFFFNMHGDKNVFHFINTYNISFTSLLIKNMYVHLRIYSECFDLIRFKPISEYVNLIIS